MLKNWVLVLYGSSEPIDKNDPVSVPVPHAPPQAINRTAGGGGVPSNAGGGGNLGRSGQPGSPAAGSPIASTARPTTTATSMGLMTTTSNKQLSKGKAKSQMGQGSGGGGGKAPARTKAQQQGAGMRKGGGKQDKNKDSDNMGGGGGGSLKKKQPVSSSNAGGGAATQTLSQQNPMRKNGINPTGRPKSPKKEVQVLNELQRKSEKAYKSSSAAANSASGGSGSSTNGGGGVEKTIKAPKQVKENANNLRLPQLPRTWSSTSWPPPPAGQAAPPAMATLGDAVRPSLTTSQPSTASTASQTRLSKVLFQKYDRIQQVYPEFHPYVPPINEAEKKASLFLPLPNPNNKKQAAGDTGKAFRDQNNGKIIFFSDSDFFPATTKPQLRPPTPITTTTAVKEQQRNGINIKWRSH